MRVTALVDNSVAAGRADLVAEHGLSVLLEREGDRILFDTGSSGAFADNAARLGVRLEEVDAAVLSHHHYDHGGGLERFLGLNLRARVHLREVVPAERWFRALGLVKRRIGIDGGLLERHPDRFEPVRGRVEILPGVHLITELSQAFARPPGNRYLWVERQGRLELDPFDHELLLVVEGDSGLVVVTGCSHNGILNLVDTAVRAFPGVPVAAVFGGFHLVGLPGMMAASRHEVEEIGRAVLRFPVPRVCTGHCTGQKAFGLLAGVMGEALEPFPTGRSVEV